MGEAPHWAYIDAALPDQVALEAVGPDDAAGRLLPEESSLVSARTAPRRREDLTRGRTAARRALARIGVAAAPIGQGPHREPLWPRGVVGSITHAGGWAVAIVARAEVYAGLGIDVEAVDAAFPGLAAEVASRHEIAALDTMPAPCRNAAIIELFSAKEAIFKAFFPRVGRYFGFDAAEVEGIGSPRPRGRLVEGLDRDYPPDRSFPIGVHRSASMVVTWLVLERDP